MKSLVINATRVEYVVPPREEAEIYAKSHRDVFSSHSSSKVIWLGKAKNNAKRLLF
jgi:hypothetical protein